MLRGDLYLVGYGDPMLATAAFARKAFVAPVATVDRLARDVNAAGIRRITGRILGDGSRFDRLRAGPLWKPGFAGLECAPLAALGRRPQPRRRQARRPAGARRRPRAARRADPRRRRVDGPAAEGRTPAGAVTVASADSPELRRVIWAMGKDSDNFTAEMVLKNVAAGEKGVGHTPTGASWPASRWRRASSRWAARASSTARGCRRPTG